MQTIKAIIGFTVLCSIFYLGYELGQKDRTIKTQATQIQTIWKQTQANTQELERYNSYSISAIDRYSLEDL